MLNLYRCTLLSLDKKNHYQFFEIDDLFLVSQIVPEAFSNPKQAKTLKSSKENQKILEIIFQILYLSEICEIRAIRDLADQISY